MARINDILIKPIITEKMTEQGDDYNKYGFIVDKKANKIQIRNAVEEMYGVTVDSVNTMRYRGKQRSRYTRAGIIRGKENSFKKAIVTLVEGDTIDFYSNI
ncbi:MAG: 50S ribosomal protein L23 [Bacteroidota bacterium]